MSGVFYGGVEDVPPEFHMIIGVLYPGMGALGASGGILGSLWEHSSIESQYQCH
jgi:hypothetical protein